MPAPGRNEPCPCGSGRKYKQCCLPRQQLAPVIEGLAWQRVRRTEGDLVELLLKFVKRRYGRTALIEAWADFTVGHDLPPDPEQSPEMVYTFQTWFLFTWRPGPGTAEADRDWPPIPIAEHYLDRHAARLDSQQTRFVAEACHRPFSFFMVVDAAPDEQTLTLRDILLQRELTVHERQASATLKAGEIIFARVITLDSVSLMLGCSPYAFPGRYLDMVIGIRDQVVGDQRQVDEAALHEFGEELRRLYFAIRADYLDRPLPELRNTDGDPIVQMTLRYEVTAPRQEVLEALASMAQAAGADELLADHAAAGRALGDEVEIPWLKTGNAQNPAWNNTLLGLMRLTDTRLVVEVNSQQRADQARRELDRRLKQKARFETVTAESLTRALQDPAGTRPAPGSRLTEAEYEELARAPEIQARIKEIAAAHWREWPDVPLPALKGLTPRAAAGTAAGRERLEALFLEFSGHSRDTATMAPDIEALRRELGM